MMVYFMFMMGAFWWEAASTHRAFPQGKFPRKKLWGYASSYLDLLDRPCSLTSPPHYSLDLTTKSTNGRFFRTSISGLWCSGWRCFGVEIWERSLCCVQVYDYCYCGNDLGEGVEELTMSVRICDTTAGPSIHCPPIRHLKQLIVPNLRWILISFWYSKNGILLEI